MVECTASTKEESPEFEDVEVPSSFCPEILTSGDFSDGVADRELRKFSLGAFSEKFTVTKEPPETKFC